MQSMKNAVCRVRRPEQKVDRTGSRAADRRQRKRLERNGGFLVRDGIFLSLEETVRPLVQKRPACHQKTDLSGCYLIYLKRGHCKPSGDG